MGFFDDLWQGTKDFVTMTDAKSKLKVGKMKVPTKFTQFTCSCRCRVDAVISVSNEVFVALKCSGCGKEETLYVE